MSKLLCCTIFNDYSATVRVYNVRIRGGVGQVYYSLICMYGARKIYRIKTNKKKKTVRENGDFQDQHFR